MVTRWREVRRYAADAQRTSFVHDASRWVLSRSPELGLELEIATEYVDRDIFLGCISTARHKLGGREY